VSGWDSSPLLQVNEAFSVVAMANAKILGLGMDKVRPNLREHAHSLFPAY
jgi:hypothetical protein